MRLKRRNEEAETLRREEKEERATTKQNVSAGEFCQTKKREGRKEGEAIELYPKGGLMTIHSEKFGDKGLENNVGKSVMHSDKFSDKGLENDIGKL